MLLISSIFLGLLKSRVVVFKIIIIDVAFPVIVLQTFFEGAKSVKTHAAHVEQTTSFFPGRPLF